LVGCVWVRVGRGCCVFCFFLALSESGMGARSAMVVLFVRVVDCEMNVTFS